MKTVFSLALAIALALVVVRAAEPVSAQQRRRARPLPFDARVQWTVFVSAYRDRPASRNVVSEEPGTIPLPLEAWQCAYSAPTRTQIDASRWSEVRTLECTHGDARVSTSGSCQVTGATWSARAGVLSLGTRTSEGRVDVTLDCAVVP